MKKASLDEKSLMLEEKTDKTQKNSISEKEKLFLIDGHSFCYRAFYAVPFLTNSKGEPTNAIYGFAAILRKIVQEYRPHAMAVCFDRKEATFRHKSYEQYKAHRKPMPEDLQNQIEPIKEFCKVSNYLVFEKAGYEADDLIGTIAKKGEEKGYEVFMVTGDKDALQLVNQNIKALNPHKEGLIYDTEKTKERFSGLGPEKIIDVMALMGDASDNIPGVPGIGEKTAVKLIQNFNSVEELFKNIDKIKSEKQKKLLEDNKEKALLSKELAKIDTSVPVEIDWEKLKMGHPKKDKFIDFCKRYELRTLLKEAIVNENKNEEKREYVLIDDKNKWLEFIKKIGEAKTISVDTETTSSDAIKAELVGLSFSWEPLKAYYVPVANISEHKRGIEKKEIIEKIKPILENSNIQKYGQNIKYDGTILNKEGIDLRGISFDTMIASYLINPIKRNHNLDDISMEYLSVKKISIEDLVGKGKNQKSMTEVPIERITEYAAEDADCVFRLVPILREKLKELKLTELFEKTELPLAEVLMKMEMNGVALDTDLLKELSDKTEKAIVSLEKKIYTEAGESFNIGSPKQLAEILFVKKKLPPLKKNKTGYSTDASVLEKLSVSYDLPKMVLEYREKAKLKSTYLDALPEMINSRTGFVHTSYHQATTDTGRLSSSEPNLQNIPIRTEEGRLIRKAFIPRNKKKNRILSADYSQIELRILAHFSEDNNLTKAFEEDKDVHSFTATLLYGAKEKDVTRQMRHLAKTINFSVVYGKTSFGLSGDLGISIAEADDFIKNYFKRYSGVSCFLEKQKERARKDGYLTTLLGRRSYFPNIHSKNVQIRQYSERAAINAPIQGSAADLIKLAMISIQNRIEKENKKSLMTMQVHDELVFDVPLEEVDFMKSLVREEMEKVYSLKVPLKVDIFLGDTWYKN